MLKIVGTLLLCFIVLREAAAQDLTVLSRTAGWKRLVHYQPDLASPTGLKSAIHSRDFFLSESGETDPEAELSATLAVMLQPVSGQQDAHAKCRFPARLLWLQRYFPEHLESLSPINCPEFIAWSNLDEIDSVSLVFANGYLGNPASYYGHIFLKINNKGSSASDLLNRTLNFGAIETTKDDPVSYILKGVTGGYDGAFSSIDFYFHDANYGEIELRDLWEYRLDLPVGDVHYIVSHAWEVMHKHYVYYFFHDNCAFRIGELLEIVDGIEVNPHRPWVIPQAVLQKVSQSAYLGKPLIASKIYHPSRQTRLYHRYASLNADQRGAISGIVNKDVRIEGPEMQHLPLAEQQAVIDTLLDYHQFKNDLKQKGEKKLAPEYVEALTARLRLPPGEITKPVKKTNAPHTGNAPSWIQIGIVHYQDRRNTLTLRIRPAYYDPLDVSGAQAKNSGMSMGDVLLELDGKRLRILRFDAIAIDSINPAVTGLPGDRGAGWRLRAGLEQERLACTQCLAARIQGDYTLGASIGSPKVFGAINAGGVLQGHADFDGMGFARLGASVIVRPLGGLGFRASYEVRRPFKSAKPYPVASVEGRASMGRDYDLRALWERDTDYRVTIGVGYYW